MEFNFQNKEKLKLEKNKFEILKKKSDFFPKKIFYTKKFLENILFLKKFRFFFSKILFQIFIKSFLKLKFLNKKYKI